MLLRQAKSHSQQKRLKLPESDAQQCVLYRSVFVRQAVEQMWYGDAGKVPNTQQSRLNLMKAGEGDCGTVIDCQTQHTTEGMLVADGILSVCILGL